MDTNLLANLLNGSLCLISLFIAVRAFVRYFQLRSPRLIILVLSMSMIALTAAADIVGENVAGMKLNTNWFLYIGQTVSFGYIFLSLFCRSDRSLRHLLLWQIIMSVPLLSLLVLSPIMPAFPDLTSQAILSGSRGLICFLIFSRYLSSFLTTKQTFFGLLMSIAFLALSVGYLLILFTLFFAHMDIVDQIGDIIRIGGLVVLLVGYVLG